MDPSAYLTAIRRRWPIVIATVGIAVILASLTASFSQEEQAGEYRASALLLGSPLGASSSRADHLGTLGVLATNGPVPERVADSIGYDGDPRDLAADVTVESHPELGFLSITATAGNPDRAEQIAHTFADELVDFVRQSKAEGTLGDARQITRQMRKTAGEIEDLEGQIQASNDPVLIAERDARVRHYGSLAEQREELTAAAFAQPTVSVLDKAPAETVEAANAVSLSNPLTRILIGTVIGLFAGAGLAIALERIDTRIRTRKAAEIHFSYPVLAEIPEAPRRARGDRAVVAAAHPSSPFATAFRLLATGVTGRLPADATEDSPDQLVALQPPQTILVTSAGAGEGKTTVTANLAASFAEQGKKTLIVSCDFRNPHIHRMFGVPNDKGLAEALTSRTNDRILVDGHVKRTSINEIRVVPSSSGPENPGGLLGSDNMQQVLQEARESADVVLLDTPPILTGAEATFLFPEVDAVLVVARAGTTTVELAERTSELLKRLGTPVIGVALNGAATVGASKHSYRESKAKKAKKKASKAGDGPATAVTTRPASDRPEGEGSSGKPASRRDSKSSVGGSSSESSKSRDQQPAGTPAAQSPSRSESPMATDSSNVRKVSDDTQRIDKPRGEASKEVKKWEL
jgi:capsular exopolysaccharide synthesis family protein